MRHLHDISEHRGEHYVTTLLFYSGNLVRLPDQYNFVFEFSETGETKLIYFDNRKICLSLSGRVSSLHFLGCIHPKIIDEIEGKYLLLFLGICNVYVCIYRKVS